MIRLTPTERAHYRAALLEDLDAICAAIDTHDHAPDELWLDLWRTQDLLGDLPADTIEEQEAA
jgi:hypothetical protein